MPVKLEWDDSQQSILSAMCSSPWNWHEVFEMFEQVIVLTEEAQCRVDLILHGDGRLNTPTGNPWPLIRALSRRIPPNAGLQVVVKPDAFAQIIYGILHSALPNVSERIRFVKSLEEARSLIAQARTGESLPN